MNKATYHKLLHSIMINNRTTDEEKEDAVKTLTDIYVSDTIEHTVDQLITVFKKALA